MEAKEGIEPASRACTTGAAFDCFARLPHFDHDFRVGRGWAVEQDGVLPLQVLVEERPDVVILDLKAAPSVDGPHGPKKPDEAGS